MASTTISTPIRGVTRQLTRLSIRQHRPCVRCAKSLCTPTARSITTSAPSQATVSDVRIKTIKQAPGYVPVTPLEHQTVLATIHQFPSLEPLRFEKYPANHLYLPTRRDILHRAVVYEGDATRLGTASTKTRHEVHGSRRKVRPQKGTGHARLGDRMSPMLRGGGVAFGPKPRDFSSELPKKVYDLAFRTALSYRFRKGELIIVDNAMELESPSTRLLADIFRHHEKLWGRGRSLMVTLEERPLLEQALVDMDRRKQAILWNKVDVKYLLELSRIIIERDALQNILLSHEEDLTHKAIQPWHRGLVRSLPPSNLESTIGWEDFRQLSLAKPEEKEATRIEVYGNVAAARYGYAETLPQGTKRTEMTLSAYELLTEAKQLEFEKKTGLTFSDYSQNTNTDDFPRAKALDYQISIKNDLVDQTAQTNRLLAEKYLVDVRELELQKLELLSEASLLAAQIFEQLRDTLELMGEAERAEEMLEAARNERTSIEEIELNTLEARVELSRQIAMVAGMQGDFIRQEKMQQEVEAREQELETRRVEIEAQNALLEEASEEVDGAPEETGSVIDVEGRVAEPSKEERSSKEERRL
ncbi:50s ribosomal protein l4 [Pyrenophora tritici-repentis]|uniref:Large ribosomal subunit protein uL4m n=1 Tax=Pyrenophora tritici-repentis TaxID=45151 RepID=A0A2W1ERG8_9PLEO|nr:50s ribosomal protein l4 [Pyrenophora tritici-repentis]KAI1671773.1 50s ribosomal protein l4 [Pyrenophora tritici-repentis]KAI1676112.1 50s ribosomal protein l4 [Pyrenophora tritici-repentis]KAI1676525.1 50s ribosomal protein l4 [Pyrenophora tritici-repentis]KAI1685617.1 50s ribosomal protein l4 [Pyrenophora tritici-repentis]